MKAEALTVLLAWHLEDSKCLNEYFYIFVHAFARKCSLAHVPVELLMNYLSCEL